MDLVNRLLAWAAYVTGAVLIGSCAFFAFHYYRQGGRPEGIVLVEPRGGAAASSGTVGGPDAGSRVPTSEQLYLQRAQIRRLQTLLDQKTQLLQQKTALLDQKNAEHQGMRAELDDAIELLEVLAAEVAGRDSPASAGRGTDEQLQAELERLREESEKSRTVTEQQQGELDRLKDELGATDLGITQVEQQAETQFSALAADHDAFEAVVSETLVRIGVDAVPALVYQLAHPRADVRRWAAVMLGELGPTGREAIPPLQEALKDKDSGVRDAARRALEKVDPPQR
jgi:hypothetical protein